VPASHAVSSGLCHLLVRVRGAEAAGALFALLDDLAAAVSAFESGPGEWRVEAYPKSPVLCPDLEARLALAAAAAGGVLLDIREEILSDRDWLAENQLAFPPLRIGRFFIYGSHYRGEVPGSTIAIRLDAATAFGTGEHPSTRGCLAVLEFLAQRKRITRPLDIGAGTGILSIAAARLLRCRVMASDIDPGSVAVARHNVARNGVAALVRVRRADGYRGRGMRRHQHDLVLANILARPLALLAADLARTLAPGGRAVLSGLLRRQEAIVLAPHRALGVALERRIEIDGWSTLVLRSGAGPRKKMGTAAPIYRLGSSGFRLRRPGGGRNSPAAAMRPALRRGRLSDRRREPRGSPSGECRYRRARDRRAPSARHKRAAAGANRKRPLRPR
jgi:ribosomal protein L11 methyltransferase